MSHKTIHSHGHITLIIGPMSSSKTTALIGCAKRFTIAKKKIIIVKYSKDIRYENTHNLITHDKQTYTPDYQTDNLLTLDKLYAQNLEAIDCILIDEGQFFNDLYTFCQKYADMGKKIVVAGLEADFLRHPFPNICNLLSIVDEIIKLKAVCTLCGEDAIFSKRLVNNDNVELIGGLETYTARCRICWFI